MFDRLIQVPALVEVIGVLPIYGFEAHIGLVHNEVEGFLHFKKCEEFLQLQRTGFQINVLLFYHKIDQNFHYLFPAGIIDLVFVKISSTG